MPGMGRDRGGVAEAGTAPAWPAAADQPLGPLPEDGGSLGDRVHRVLRSAIVELRLRPGAIIRKAEVCAALGVSRSPVAEAVARLSVEGLVRVVPQAGTFVARLSLAAVREGAFLREALEGAAAESVAGTANPAEVAALRDCLERQREAAESGDGGVFYREDARLHETILGMTGHRTLPVLSRTAWVHLDRARRLMLPVPGRMAESLEEHHRIVEAIAMGEADAARAAMRHHLRAVLARLEEVAAERPELFS